MMQFKPQKRADGRARAEERLADERHAPLQTMLDHVVQGIAMFDSGHRLVAWNARLQQLLDLPEASLAERPTFQAFINVMAERGDFGPRSPSADAAIRALTSDIGVPCIDERMLADGRVLECRRDPLPDGGLILTYTDLSEQRHSDFLVKDSERQVRTILDKAPVALAVISQEDGKLKHVNARFRRLFGLSDETQPETIDLTEHMAGTDRDHILETQPGTPMVDFESEARRVDGSEFWALVAPVRFVFEWAPAILTGFYDISDRKRAEASLRDELERRQIELTEARTLQLELAPPSIRGTLGDHAYSIDVVLEPAREVGGDLVDHFEIDDSLFVLVVGDVSHKGAGSALFMARTHSLIRGIAARPDAADLFREPAGAANLINASLAKNNATNMFVTLLLASFDATTGRLAYVRAGHVPPFLRRADGAIERLSVLGGPPLGIADDVPYKSGSVDLRQKDQLLTVTDGITEAMDEAGNPFGEAPVKDFLSTLRAGDRAPLALLIAAVRHHEAGQPASDDIAGILFAIT